MNHPGSETLALVALEETEPSHAEREHLAGCAACTRELRQLRRIVATGRAARTVELTAPSEQLWGRIHGALGLSEAVAAQPGPNEFGSIRRRATATGAPGETAGSAGSGSTGPVISGLTPRRRGWLPLTAAAAMVGLVGGIAAGIWWQSSPAPDVAPVVATATLEPQSSWEASGRVWVEESADGHREVFVHLETAGEPVLLREVWLLSADASGLVSIGFLDGAAGRFTIPDEIDLADYPLVDVSAEFDDGDPAHSGDSIVRGELH